MAEHRGDDGHNLVPFPASRKERDRILHESDDRRVRIVAALRTAAGFLLVIGMVVFLLAYWQLFMPSSMRSLIGYAAAGLREHEGEITTIRYENDTVADGALFGFGLAYADSDALFLANPGSVTTLRIPLGYTAPVVEAAGEHVLAYDRGGTRAVLCNAAAATAELTLTSTIITGRLARDGRFLLITDEQSYRTAIAVYDTRGKEVFKYSASEYYIVSGALSPDGKTLGVLAFRQNGVSLDTHVLFYSVLTGELTGDVTLAGSLGMELCYFSSGTAAVLCDDGLYLVPRKGGEAEQALAITASDLLTFTVGSDRLALAMRSYSGGARGDLYILAPDGKLSGPHALEEEPSAVAVSSAGVAALSAAGVSVYDHTGRPLWHNSEAVGAQRVLLTDDGTVYALYTKNTRLFTAHSERSEDISDAE